MGFLRFPASDKAALETSGRGNRYFWFTRLRLQRTVLRKMSGVYLSLVALLLVFICQIPAIRGQECPGTQELQNSLRQAHKLLSTHEASYLQSLRTLRKKLSLLQNSAARLPTKANNVTCPKLEAPLNGRKLGKILLPGHEVHFLCDLGYELVGSETRQCKESLTWSGQQPVCKEINECASSPCANGGTCTDEVNGFACECAKGWAGSTCQSPTPTFFVTITNMSAATAGAAAATSFPLATPSLLVRPSKCSQVQGTTYCTCEAGYTISGRDTSICTDIDECELFHNGQAGRLCLHACVNTPGGYRCTCPVGYNVTQDGRSCRDIDECATRQNNCTRDQLCVNTYGGFQCVKVECPRIRNATYVKTSPTRCERNPCPVDNKACSQAPNSVSHHYMSVVSNLSAPRVMFRVSAVRVLGDTLRFALLGGRGRRHFTVQRSDRQTGQLMLVSPIQGPATLEVEVEMSELERRVQIGCYITKITLFVSQYEF
ncbi:fibulin-7 [Colossoma macropomum]|uniref:fibulin-7 n=1 Tax=Colossoma macropomum TaxID=42526 RepID=UPI0018652F7C|nr:fibulin-7 [Colossoma macropomum]